MDRRASSSGCLMGLCSGHWRSPKLLRSYRGLGENARPIRERSSIRREAEAELSPGTGEERDGHLALARGAAGVHRCRTACVFAAGGDDMVVPCRRRTIRGMSEPIVAVAITWDGRRRLTEAQRKQVCSDRKLRWVVDETANGRIWRHGKLAKKDGREERLSARKIEALRELLLSKVPRAAVALHGGEGPAATKGMERLARKLEPKVPRGGRRAIRRRGTPLNQTWSFEPPKEYTYALILVPRNESDVEPEPEPPRAEPPLPMESESKPESKPPSPERPLATEPPRVSCTTTSVRGCEERKLLLVDLVLVNEEPTPVRIDDLALQADGEEVGLLSKAALQDSLQLETLECPSPMKVPLVLPPASQVEGTAAFSLAVAVGKVVEVLALASVPLVPK